MNAVIYGFSTPPAIVPLVALRSASVMIPTRVPSGRMKAESSRRPCSNASSLARMSAGQRSPGSGSGREIGAAEGLLAGQSFVLPGTAVPDVQRNSFHGSCIPVPLLNRRDTLVLQAVEDVFIGVRANS